MITDSVGAPTECKLRKITCSNYEAAVLVGKAKQVVRAQPCLTFSKVMS
jgi:hypothetical protein